MERSTKKEEEPKTMIKAQLRYNFNQDERAIFFKFAADSTEKECHNYAYGNCLQVYERFVLLGLAERRVVDQSKAAADIQKVATLQANKLRRQLRAIALIGTSEELSSITGQLWQAEQKREKPKSYVGSPANFYKPTARALELIKGFEIVISVGAQ